MPWIATAFAALLLVSQSTSGSAAVFHFDATETSALSSTPTSFTFSLNTSAAMPGVGGSTIFSNVSIYRDGALVPANTVVAQYGTNLGSPLFYFIDTGLKRFSSGSGPDFTFDTGRFVIADGATDGEGTLEISTVPEPASWAMMITGIGLAGSGLRRRRSLGMGRRAV
ncbi:PEPxxWA-CTERM sorting domain-containing protein (plasmid) [Polymorphobacter sp. PAMC 29334]|uniref:PEPxxWA-CTERM sorting domain-containing protein n=1 Tax=Polymorphobacter sp. PAMC 29334 TaxID=2862331 RepID=UPI001C784174|nr:PEPxxWA-CTERM sorting domain-containing protein [Polymorphobacter sp. PAMC 29334]QYE37130.1 PEPxxWA-CTERM sorting domain-containing protein [Polymorphobacter sp. PAMC 29334]